MQKKKTKNVFTKEKQTTSKKLKLNEKKEKSYFTLVYS